MDDHATVVYVIAVVLAAACVVLVERLARERSSSATPPVDALVQGAGLRASERDKELYERFLSEFPPGRGGTIHYLRTAFFGKQWYWSKLKQLEDFLENWRHGVFFDDEVVDQARLDLLEVCEQFTSDLYSDSHTPGENDDAARLDEVQERYGGQDEWDQARARNLAGAKSVIAAHDNLVRVGRQRGL